MEKKRKINKANSFLTNIYFRTFSFLRSTSAKILLVFVLFLIIGSVGTLLFEREVNESFKNLFDSFWFLIVTIATVGYGDKYPLTIGGKILGIFIIIGGVGVMGIVSGNIASFLVARQLKEGKGLLALKKMENHFIICGWKKELPKIIEDILTVNKQLKADQIVLINTADPQLIEDIKADIRFSRIHFVFGDWTDESVLERANIRKAKTILLLADQSSPDATPQEIDSKTVMAALTIESLNKNIYACAELLDPKFEKYLKLAYCDEIILSKEYSRILLANVSTATGISHVINKLIDVGSHTPIVAEDIPENFFNTTFGELEKYYRDRDDSILIGVLENTGNVFKMKQEALKEAQKTPDISKLVENLKMVKRIVPNDPIINPGRDYRIKKNSRAILVAGKKD